jgi:hypothetical protein
MGRPAHSLLPQKFVDDEFQTGNANNDARDQSFNLCDCGVGVAKKPVSEQVGLMHRGLPRPQFVRLPRQRTRT